MLKNRYESVKALIDLAQTDVNCKDDRGRTLVSCILENLTSQSMDNLTLLLKQKKADPNIGDRDGFMPLHYACQKVRQDQYRYTMESDEAKSYLKLTVNTTFFWPLFLSLPTLFSQYYSLT